MTDDPINALIAKVLARAPHAAPGELQRVALERGFSLAHNVDIPLYFDEGTRVRRGYTLVRRWGMMVGFVTPWTWCLATEEDDLRLALLTALEAPEGGAAVMQEPWHG
jgi:hypothetical protein